MIDHERAMLAYVHLAVVSENRRQLLGRDKLLVLAAAAACRAGWPDVAERCRKLVVAHNPAHLLSGFSSMADALRGQDFPALLRQLERRLGYERAEFLVDELSLESEQAGNESPAEASPSNGERALSLLERLNFTS